MSIKKSVGVAIVLVPISLILVTITILLNNNSNDNNIEEDWTNIAEVSEEFLDRYFDDYREMRESGDPENVLLVTSKTRPEAYGATKVVEAPNYLYMLQYDDAETRDAAFLNFEADGVIVERNQIYSLMEEIPTSKENKNNKIMSVEQIYQTMGTDEEKSCEKMSWGFCLMGVDFLLEQMSELENLPTVTVAVIDSGMDSDEFNASRFVDRTVSYYCVTECGGGEMLDGADSGHGTHVAGTVLDGTLDNVQLLVIKATCDAEGHSWTSDNATAVNYAVAHNADVINMSFGGPGGSSDMYNALQAAEEAKTINVAAAGNDNVDTLYYPASYNNTLSIAALKPICENGDLLNCDAIVDVEKAEFSNYGEMIDFALPGYLITSINGLMSGTSQASPHMAAIVANLKTINKFIALRKSSAKALTKTGVKEMLKDYMIDLGDEGWDQYYGFGMPYLGRYFFRGFCNSYDCDNYDVFASHWSYDLDSLVEAFRADKMGFLFTDRYLIVASDIGPVMAIAEKGGAYTRVQAEETDYDNMRVFYFDETDPDSTIHMALVGDVDLNGTVNVLDLAKVKRSILLPTSANYQALSDKAKVLADITGDGNVNVLDLARIKRSILLPTSVNYLPLSW